MRTMFEMGFRNSFVPLMGQDITTWDQLNDTSSSGGGLPAGTITSYDQLTQPSTPSAPSGGGGGGGGGGGSGATDAAKLVAQGITAAGQGYSTYSKEQVAKINAQAQKGKAPVAPGAPVAAPSSGVNSNTVFLIGGIAVVGLIAAVALR